MTYWKLIPESCTHRRASESSAKGDSRISNAQRATVVGYREPLATQDLESSDAPVG